MKKKRSQERHHTLRATILLPLFFFIDGGAIAATGRPFINLVFCYVLAIYLEQRLPFHFFAGLLLLGFESFLISDFFGSDYSFIVPLLILVQLGIYYCASRWAIALIALICTLIYQGVFIEGFKLNGGVPNHCTFFWFGVNMLALLISLKWLSTAERGNRF